MSEEKKKITVTIDEQKIEVVYGTTILEAAKKLGIKIPNLCYHEDLLISGACRICVVEVEGSRTLQSSCSYPITEPIVVRTNSLKIRRARKHILELLIGDHLGECYICKKNMNCELQKLAKNYGIDAFCFGRKTKPEKKVEAKKPAKFDDPNNWPIQYDREKCILCERCVRACTQMQNIGVLGVADRGNDSRILTFRNLPMENVNCINCGQCVTHCPTAALTERDDTHKIWKAIEDPTKHVVIQTAPSPRAGIGECFGLEPGHPLTFQMNTALRRCGFDKIFDTNFAADLTVIEEGTELILRLYKALVEKDKSIALPMFTSCSPGWVKFLEHSYPEYLDNLSSAKSPQQMFGTLIKTYYAQLNNIDPKDIVCAALMPCTAKKYECDRPEMYASGHKDVDFGLTTRELAAMISEMGIDLPNVPKSNFDDPFGSATGSGIIFGCTGGVMESALRTVLEFITGGKIESIFAHANIVPVRGFEGIRYVEMPIEKIGPVPDMIKHLVPNWDWIKGITLKVAVAHGIANAKKVMDDINQGGKFSECQFIEFMACPGGCIGGGGQPVPTSPEIRAKRAEAIYADDIASPVRKSYENPAVVRVYKEFLTDGPCGHVSHKLLHTKYTARGKYIKT